MIWIVLAAGLGVANFITVALLFRRLRRNLNRQLINMRAERNSEWILSALKEAGTPGHNESTAQAVNGNGYEPPPAHPEPVRRKRHLGLFLGGGLSAALLTTLQEAFSGARKTRHGRLAVSAATLTAAATTASLLIAAPWPHPHRAPDAAPTVTIISPGPSRPAPPVARPPGSSTASTPPPSGATVGPSATAPGGTPGANGDHLTPIDQRNSLPQHPPSRRPSGSSTPAPPGQGSPTPAPPTSPSASASSTPAQPPAAGGLCVVLDLDPLLALRLCPLGGG